MNSDARKERWKRVRGEAAVVGSKSGEENFKALHLIFSFIRFELAY